MSVLSEVKLNNLLNELNLEPTWDKVKRYLLSISIGVTLYPLFITLEGLDVKCLPIDLSIGENPSLENERTELTDPQTEYVNKRCARDVKMAGVTDGSYKMLISGMIILIFSTFWLYRKNVAESLRRFDKARRLMDDSTLTVEEKKELCKEILTRKSEHAEDMEDMHMHRRYETYGRYGRYGRYERYGRCERYGRYQRYAEEIKRQEDHRKVREICLLVTVDGPKRLLFNMYVIRMLLLLVSYKGCIFLIAADLIAIRKVDDTFTCQLKEFMPVTPTNGTSLDLFICTANQAKAIRICLILFLISIVSQYMTVWMFIWAYVDNGLPKYDANIRKSLKLLLVLSDYSKKCKQLEELIEYLHSKEYKEAVLKRASDIIENQDYRLIQIVAKIFKEELINHLLKSFEEDASSTEKEWYIKIIKAAKYREDDSSTCALTGKLIDAKKWNVLVELVGNSKLKKFKTERQSRPIPLDVLDEPAIGERRSILYYAFHQNYFSGRNKLAAAKILCKGRSLEELKIFRQPKGPTTITQIGLKEFLKESFPHKCKDEIDKIIKSLPIKKYAARRSPRRYQPLV